MHFQLDLKWKEGKRLLNRQVQKALVSFAAVIRVVTRHATLLPTNRGVHHLVLKDKIPGAPIEIPGCFPLPFDSGVLTVAEASKIIEGFFLKY